MSFQKFSCDEHEIFGEQELQKERHNQKRRPLFHLKSIHKNDNLMCVSFWHIFTSQNILCMVKWWKSKNLWLHCMDFCSLRDITITVIKWAENNFINFNQVERIWIQISQVSPISQKSLVGALIKKRKFLHGWNLESNSHFVIQLLYIFETGTTLPWVLELTSNWIGLVIIFNSTRFKVTNGTYLQVISLKTCRQAHCQNKYLPPFYEKSPS